MLLHVLERGQLDITAVSLVAVADQYLAYVRLLPAEAMQLDFLAEFLLVGAQLLLLKSRALLPREAKRVEPADPLDEAALDRRLAEYRRYREAATRLGERQEQGRRAFARINPPPLPPPGPPPRLEAAAPDQLARALGRLLAARQKSPEPAQPARVSLAERIECVRMVVEQRGQVSFSWLADGCVSRADLILTFLAILDLYRSRVVQLQQDELFGEIWLSALQR